MLGVYGATARAYESVRGKGRIANLNTTRKRSDRATGTEAACQAIFVQVTNNEKDA